MRTEGRGRPAGPATPGAGPATVAVGLSSAGVDPDGVDDQTRWARAFLSRVAEPAHLDLWALVRRVGPVDAVAALQRGGVSGGLGDALAGRLRQIDPDADLDAAARHGIRLVVPESPQWPHFAFGCLERTGQALVESTRPRADPAGAPVPPLALWVRGPAELSTLGVRSVSIVGSRAATPYGCQVAGELAYGLSTRDVTVVSGGAYGIDAAAHRGALAAASPTVLVSAGGLDQAYPPRHDELFRRIAATGLLVSESPPGAAPQRRRFLTRNRLIAALGTGTVIVESAARSGARNTAGHCWRLGRPLMAVPGPVTSAQSAGNHELLRDTDRPTHLVTSVADVLDVIGAPGEGAAVTGAPPGPPAATTLGARLDDLDAPSRHVYDALPARGTVSVTDLVRLAGLRPGAVLSALPLLSLAGLVTQDAEGVRRSPTGPAGQRRPRPVEPGGAPP